VGTHRPSRHGGSNKAREGVEQAAGAFGPLERPPNLKGEAQKAWDQWIAPAAWLDGSGEPAAIAFCELWAEFRQAPARFIAARHSQMRAYMAVLGLTDERNRPARDSGDTDPFFND
jgi:hypothetical protein